MQRSLRVSGIGIVSAFGTSPAAFRDGLLAGRSAIVPLSGFETGDCRTTLAAQVTDFEAAAWVAPMKLRRLDRTGVYALALARLVLADAQRTPTPDGDDRSGVVLGTWTAGGQSTQQYLDAFFRSGPASAPALLFDSTVANSAASLAGMEYKLRGPNVTVSHKEASGLGAIVCAAEMLRAERACGLLTGGVDAVFEPFFKAYDRFAVMSGEAAFSSRLAPFDDDRAGFVLGEGGFGLWLEQSDDRTAGQGEEVLGVAAAGAAVGLNLWPDRPAPLVRTMRLALEDAGLSAEDVDVVYASANATADLDVTEAAALSQLFAGSRTVVTSLKGALGEFGASGGAACAAAFLCGREGRVPPIAGLAKPIAAAGRLNLARQAVDAPGPIVLVNGFASGGALFSVVLRTGRKTRSA
ncbi:MAG: beta-ketoacyl synthase N-terminal-like domain-containing protein [Acidobacteriota bacterium]